MFDLTNGNKHCIFECKLDREARTCEGCGRTLEEIAAAGRIVKCQELPEQELERND